MSTHASIIKKNSNGTYTGVYSHSDGYITHGAGQMLAENWKSPCRVDLLIAEGDISRLADTLDVSVFYIRDKGEDATEMAAFTCDTLAAIVDDLGDNEHNYVFEGGQWMYFFEKTKMVPLHMLIG